MPVGDDLILAQSLRCLLAHNHPEWGDRDAFDVFNRLLAKNIRAEGWTSNTHLNIRGDQIKSRRERWTTQDLGKLTLGHGSAQGKDFDCPIIVAEFEGKQRLLDGNHRINRWIAAGDQRLHDVNIHTVDGEGQFVVPPSATKDD
jgi:hypothetical protein